MNLYVSLYVVHGDKFLNTAWYFTCRCLLFQKMKHLPHCGHWQNDTKKISCGGWIQNDCHTEHNVMLFPLYGFFKCIVWWFQMILLNISSTRNHLFLQSALNRDKSCWILLTSLCLFHPPGMICFSFITSSTWPGSCWVMLALLWIFHPQVTIIFFARAPLTGPGFC